MASARKRAARALGIDAEQAVVDRLRSHGARILARNWRGGGGELDVVAVRNRKLRFVEVKARTGALGDPADVVTPTKRRRLVGAARAWLRDHLVDVDEMAFLIAVVAPSHDRLTIDWIDDAFEA